MLDALEKSPWTNLSDQEPPKNQYFWVWDNQLERIIKSVKWFDADIQDWGSDTDPWSGSFSYWMLQTDIAVAAPDAYEN